MVDFPSPAGRTEASPTCFLLLLTTAFVMLGISHKRRDGRELEDERAAHTRHFGYKPTSELFYASAVVFVLSPREWPRSLIGIPSSERAMRMSINGCEARRRRGQNLYHKPISYSTWLPPECAKLCEQRQVCDCQRDMGTKCCEMARARIVVDGVKFFVFFFELMWR